MFPVMALSGQFEVEEVIQESPEKLWFEIQNEAGVTKSEFEDYYRGSKMAFGIKFKDVKNFQYPVSLFNLRKTWLGFSPPQIYRYLPRSEYKLVFSRKELLTLKITRIKTYLFSVFYKPFFLRKQSWLN